MKSLLELYAAILRDAESWFSTPFARDYKTIASRVEEEGLSFITITLPTLGKAFDRWLAEGRLDPSTTTGFACQRRTAIPAFLQGLLSRIFDPKTGVLLDAPDIRAIYFFRQLCRLAGKVKEPCSAARNRAAIRRFVETDEALRSVPPDHSWLLRVFARVSRVLYGDLNRDFSVDALVPRHGPGTTAQGLRGNSKYKDFGWPQRLGRVFPADSFRFFNLNHLLDQVQYLEEHSPRDELPVRVVFVPKTMSSPRTIAIEPVCMQYAQQAVAQWLMPELEDRFVGRLNFTDQGLNQARAVEGSKTGYWATIDLSDASDRVSCRLAWATLSGNPALREAVFACRSSRAMVPGVGVIPLRKFASMGSALCFPIESMAFFAAATLGVYVARNGLTRSETPAYWPLRRAMTQCTVYGDDIVVPSDAVESVIWVLETLGLQVNRNKTFWTGKFRESCGVDAYDGQDVTPVYMRYLLPGHRDETTSIVSSVSLGNQLYKAGLWNAASYVKEQVDKVMVCPVLKSERTSGVYHQSYSTNKVEYRWNNDLHRYEGRVPRISQRRKPSAIDGWHALLERATKDLHPESRVEETRVVPGAKLRARWTPILS